MSERTMAGGVTREMKTVRLREGVYADGHAVGSVGSPVRVVHLVAVDTELDADQGVRTCCGAEFAAGALEEVRWGQLWPHNLCVRRSPWSRSVMEELFQAGEIDLAVMDGPEMNASVQAADSIMRGRVDWVQDGEFPPCWEFTASFNGVLAGERRFPRQRDLGFDALTAQLVKSHVFRVSSCGVREGCPNHATRTATFSLDELDLIKHQLSEYEYLALCIDLHEMAWCVFVGECSRTTTDTLC